MNRRLERLANGSSPPFLSATMQSSDLLRAANVAGAGVMVGRGAWKAGLAALEQEWRRALLYGFTQREVDEQITALLAGADEAAERASTRTSAQLVSQLTNSIREDVVFSTPSDTRDRLHAWTKRLTPSDVSGIFSRNMALDQPQFFLSTTIAEPQAEAAILGVWQESATRAVNAPVPPPTQRFIYSDYGPAGRVVRDERLPELDARLVTFANNVRLNIKRTPFEKNTVRVSVRVAGGTIALEDGPIGLSSLMTAFSAAGLERYSVDDLRSLTAGRHVQLGLTTTPTAFSATYATTPDDLSFQLQLAAAYIIHPGYRPEAERAWREGLVRSWARLDADPRSTFANRGVRLLAQGDRRLGTSPDDGGYARSFTELKSWLDPWLSHGAIEIAIVGDIDEDKAIQAVAATLGALPDRSSDFGPVVSRRKVTFVPPGDTILLIHQGEPDQALVNLYWHVDINPEAEAQQARVLGVLGAIFQLKVLETVREELGVSYSPVANFSASAAYPGLAYLAAGAEVAPGDVGKVSSAIRQIAGDLNAGRITADDLSRVLAPLRAQLPLHTTSNSYWLMLMSEAQTRPSLLRRLTLAALSASIDAVSLDDVKTAAARWLGTGMDVEVKILPRNEARLHDEDQ